MTKTALRKIESWKDASRLKIYRDSPCGTYTGLIESGVNYFVLALEQLGAVTQYSCEGHPNGFYIVFTAPLKTAIAISACGFFNVELEGQHSGKGNKARWSLRINHELNSEQAKKRILTWAAEAWCKKFGALEITPMSQLRTKNKNGTSKKLQ